MAYVDSAALNFFEGLDFYLRHLRSSGARFSNFGRFAFSLSTAMRASPYRHSRPIVKRRCISILFNLEKFRFPSEKYSQRDGYIGSEQIVVCYYSTSAGEV